MHNIDIKEQSLLLVHAGNESKRFIAHKLKKLGVTLVCLNRERVGALEGTVDHWIVADLNNERECLERIREYNAHHVRHRIDGAITFWEESVLLTARITDAFGLVGIPAAVAREVKNKFAFRQFCQRHNLPAPRHQLLTGKKDIPRIAKELKFPVVVKPMYGACSAFVVRANNRKELEETYDYVKNNIKSFWLSSEWENLEIFVEEYIDGDEVDIDLLLQNGKIKFDSISDNFRKDRGKFFVDSGQGVPSSLPASTQGNLMSMAEETLEKLGIQNGCIHFEAKATNDGACPIEINMRMGGDYVYSYVKSAWSVDLVECAAKIALGHYVKIDRPEAPRRYIIGWDLQPEASGILVEQNIAEQINEKPYLDKISLFKEVGDAVLRPPEGYDSLGWITVTGDTLLDAQGNLQEALGLIQYKVVEFDDKSVVGKTARKNRLSAAVITKHHLLRASTTVRLATLPNQRHLHIGIVGNKSHFNHREIPVSVRAVANNVSNELNVRGYRTSMFDFNDIGRAFNAVRRSEVDFIVNLAEGINHEESLKPHAAAMIEALQVPYSGSSAFTIALCRDRIRSKKILQYHTIPTPKWDYAHSMRDSIREDLHYPLIVKPSERETSSHVGGVVVRTPRQLVRQMKELIETARVSAFVEEYIAGAIYEVSILGNRDDDFKVLPLARAVAVGRARRRRLLNAKLESVITEIALDTYQIMRCRDYGRVRLCIDADDNPYILGVDPNPPLDHRSQFVESAALMGLGFGDLIEEIIRVAIKRYREQKP